MKYIIPIFCVLLVGCASSGTYWKFDGDGNVVEHHRWKAKGSQNTEIHETYKIDTKQKSPLENLVTLNDAKIQK